MDEDHSLMVGKNLRYFALQNENPSPAGGKGMRAERRL
jgi:hypothetical protein